MSLVNNAASAAEEEHAMSYDERTETRYVSDDGQRLIVVTRWLDQQVSPPRWRSKNDHWKLRANEREYLRQHPEYFQKYGERAR
jgi:hypothetical protein